MSFVYLEKELSSPHSVHVHIMILLKHGLLYFLFLAGVFAENSNIEDAKDTAKNEIKDKVDNKLHCFSCSVSNAINSPDDPCVNPSKGLKIPIIDCPKKCFTFVKTRSSDKNGIFSKKIVRGCSSIFPADLEKEVKEKFENSDNYEMCGDTETKFDKIKNATISNRPCGSVCDTDFCNNNMPGESGLSTGAIIGIVCGSVFGLALIIGIVVFFMKKKDYKQPPEQQDMDTYGIN